MSSSRATTTTRAPAGDAAGVDDVLAVIARRAPSLRASGVRRVALEGLSFDLDPPEPEPLSKDEIERRAAAARDPLKDSSMYGRDDGSLPGLRRFEEYDDG